MTERPHLRLVERRPLPRLSIRISVGDGRFPVGRTREFKITERELSELLSRRKARGEAMSALVLLVFAVIFALELAWLWR